MNAIKRTNEWRKYHKRIEEKYANKNGPAEIVDHPNGSHWTIEVRCEYTHLGCGLGWTHKTVWSGKSLFNALRTTKHKPFNYSKKGTLILEGSRVCLECGEPLEPWEKEKCRDCE